MKARLQSIDSYLMKFTTYMDFYLVKKPKYFSKVHFILKKTELRVNAFKWAKMFTLGKGEGSFNELVLKNCWLVACCSWPILNVCKMNFCHFLSKNPNTCICWHVHQCSSTCQHVYIHCVSHSSWLVITITIVASHYLSYIPCGRQSWSQTLHQIKSQIPYGWQSSSPSLCSLSFMGSYLHGWQSPLQSFFPCFWQLCSFFFHEVCS
jgi:hypothetical protein